MTSLSLGKILLSLSFAFCFLTQAQEFPTKPIEVIVPFNPGTAPTMMPSAVPNKMSPSTSGDVNRSTILAFFSVFAENHCAKQNDRAKHKPLKRWQGWRALDLDILQLDAAACDGLLQFIAG